eukprot:TRINITY_DN1166_c0_g5_i2.p1 TRINITY_DN1166_c0_g5~~TRINITY_DN1166_c0_g5_i2.p1  ORF type:complete len:654 (-),score=277.61 TRINITY_DN1166_c0_g5_i2:104-2065(-)
MRAACILALPAVAAASQSHAAVTPVQKVIEMLNGMTAKGEKMKEAEAKTFAEYKEWVSDRSRELGFEIKTGKSNIEKLTAFIDKADNEVAELADAIAELDADIARMEGEKKEATDLRTEEHAEFLKVEQDYSESVDALQRAIQVISSQQYARPQAMMLLQKMAKNTPGMRRVMAAFIQEDSTSQEDGAPAVAAYEAQGGGVLAMLEGLLEKFKGELSDVQKEESNKAHYYDLEMIHLSDTIAKSQADRQEKAALKATTTAASAKAKGDLADTKASLEEDETVLRDMQALFKTKSATFDTNQQVRTDELEAIAKATEIISSPEVAGSYSDRVNLAQTSSFLQMRSSTARVSVQKKAAAFLQKRAGALSSRTLSDLSMKMLDSPFAKVTDMIESLLAKLKEEAAAEADHKQWCDEELKNNKLKRNKQTAAVDRLSATVQEQTGQIEDMADKIATLLKEQEELTKAMAEATDHRQAEKKENLAIIADAKGGNAAVKKALVVLREFYASQGSFLQAGQVPEMAAYSGMSSAKGGVVGMLEVIETDFARLEADTTAAEKQAATEYDSFMEDSQADKKSKHEFEVKTKLEKDQTEFERSQTKKELAMEEEELSKANEYYEYLKPNCLEVKVSYEERVARRKEELAALNEAYDILGTKGA